VINRRHWKSGTHRESRVATMLVALFICLIVAPAYAQTALGRYHIDPDKVTVSGISSGGYMAVQLGVAYSSVFSGVGVFAAGPYGCAETGGSAHINSRRAVGPCMAGHYALPQRSLCNLGWASCPGLDAPDADASILLARREEAQHHIDPLSNLARQRVFLFSGKKDDTVNPNVVDALSRFYETFVPAVQIERVRRAGVAHTFPTATFSGNDCAVSDSPFVSNCNYDGAKHVLWHLYGALNTDSDERAATPVIQFDQMPFFPAGTNPGMADTGYIYVPAACTVSGSPPCRLHVALHGCMQTVADVGMAFVEGAGYNRWAETNGVIVLYPQTSKTNGIFSDNPQGCWDWWGYSGAGWDAKGSLQMRAIIAMVNWLKSPAP
jgi:acetyl esterase/lipase